MSLEVGKRYARIESSTVCALGIVVILAGARFTEIVLPNPPVQSLRMAAQMYSFIGHNLTGPNAPVQNPKEVVRVNGQRWEVESRGSERFRQGVRFKPIITHKIVPLRVNQGMTYHKV